MKEILFTNKIVKDAHDPFCEVYKMNKDIANRI